MTHTCLCCKTEFEAYETEIECGHCIDGSEEVESEFCEGSFWRECRECNGTGVDTFTETSFCNEECREIYEDCQIYRAINNETG